MTIPLEDNVSDIVGKAQRGLQISDSQLAEKSGATAEQIRAVRDGKFDRDSVTRIAPVLQLNAQALLGLAAGEWKPQEVEPMKGLAHFNTTFHDMTVNAYLVWDPESKDAAAVDTGADCSDMLKRIEAEGLKVKFILLTHAHPDHIADLDRLRKKTGAPVFISEREPLTERSHSPRANTFASAISISKPD